jgi:hypothetical protein
MSKRCDVADDLKNPARVERIVERRHPAIGDPPAHDLEHLAFAPARSRR